MDNLNGSNNIIGEGSSLKGNLNTSGNIRLEGKVTGDISSGSKVVCGETIYDSYFDYLDSFLK